MALKDNDEVQFYLQFTPDKKNIMLQISAPNQITPAEYLLCLMDFIEASEKEVDTLFDVDDDFVAEKH